MGIVFAVWIYSMAARTSLVNLSAEEYCAIEMEPVAFVLSGFCAWGGHGLPSVEREPAGPCITMRDIFRLRRWIDEQAGAEPRWQPEVDVNGCITVEGIASLQTSLSGALD